MFTIIVATKLNEKIFNLKQQLFTNALNKSYISRNNNSNNTISSFNLLNIFFRLSNNTILQLL